MSPGLELEQASKKGFVSTMMHWNQKKFQTRVRIGAWWRLRIGIRSNFNSGLGFAGVDGMESGEIAN